MLSFISNNLNFTNIIVNSTLLDQGANYCLTPLHGLLRTVYGSKKVRVFHVDSNTQKVEEQSYLPYLEGNLWKITSLVLNILCFIPGTFVGICLKRAAQYQQEVKDKTTIFLKSRKFLEIKLKKEEIDPVFGSIPKEIFFHIIGFLPPMDVGRLECVNKDAWNLLNSPQTNLVLNYRKQQQPLKGCQIKDPDPSFHSAIEGLKEAVETFHYTPELVKLFGGLENFLRIPLYQYKDPNRTDAYEVIEELANNPDIFERARYDVYPFVFRLRLKWYNEGVQEVILFKYSLFMPRELDNSFSQKDDVWWDYFFLRWNANWKSWVVVDARDSRALPPGLRKNMGGSEFKDDFDACDYPSIFPFELDKVNVDEFKTFLDHKPLGLFRNTSAKWDDLPQCIFKKHKIPMGRVFGDFPIMLGLLSIEEFPTFKEEQLGLATLLTF